uniref:Nitric oxide associated 1 n=1 Tax=Spermophilus dauricus TaxID=99837 RepID=A0A8C9QNP0_SPEDA
AKAARKRRRKICACADSRVKFSRGEPRVGCCRSKLSVCFVCHCSCTNNDARKTISVLMKGFGCGRESRRCAAAFFQYPSLLGRGLPRGPSATGNYKETTDTEEHFVFPEYVPKPPRAPSPEEQLRKVLQLQQEKERQQDQRKEELELVSAALRGPGPALVLYMVDLLDLPDALLSDLPKLVGAKQLIVLGNKVDLLPQDSPGYRQRLRNSLWDDCIRAGLLPAPGHRGPQQSSEDKPGDAEENSNPSAWSRMVVRDVRLISAKTGYGIEELISALQRSWRYRGDVYLVGATNSGKSTLFNTLLESDYCTAKGTEAIDRATISPWPGTTLNLLKFPICNPTPYRMFERQKRLKSDANKAEEDLSEQEQNQLNRFKKHGYVVGKCPIWENPYVVVEKSTKRIELTPQDVKDAHWFYDTPGITKENCILNLLTEKEVNIVLPTHSIIPRTFVLKPGMVLFLGAIGRIDFLQGNQSAWFTVVASNFLPVHITSLDRADALYQKHAGHTLLQVPMGGEERMAEFPPLVAEDITLEEGLGGSEAVADIKFSSAGWVAVTPHFKDRLHLRGYTPQGTVLTVRPPLLPYIVNIKGERIKRSVAYKTKKLPSLVSNLQKKKKTTNV